MEKIYGKFNLSILTKILYVCVSNKAESGPQKSLVEKCKDE